MSAPAWPTARGALLAAALAGAAAALALRLLPAAAGAPAPVALAPIPLPGLAGASGERVDDAAERLVLANAFSARRAPPAARYQPGEAPAGADAPIAPADMPGAGAPPAPDTPTLMGTLVGGAVPMALVHFAGAEAPRLVRPGDREGGYRVQSITPRGVVLAGPAGRVTLRLDPPPDRP